MVPQRAGLNVATSGYVGVTYTYGVVFRLCKAAVDRMARDMAIELQAHQVASASLWQGLTMTERAQRNLAARPEMTESIVTQPAVGSSPEFPGRVIAALPTDPRRDEPVRRDVHHRRTRPALAHHRHRRQGHPVTARRTRLPHLEAARGGRTRTLNGWPVSNGCRPARTSATA